MWRILRPLLPLLCAAAAWPLAVQDRLPDMRWVFDRALRVDEGGAGRLQRVRAWSMLCLLYPQDEPGTESDDVWRMVAFAALDRLDARAAGFPPPHPAEPLPPQPQDPLRDLLGVRAVLARAGGVQLAEALFPACGLAVGDRVLACDGVPSDDPASLARLLAQAAGRGRTTLCLDQDRSLEIAFTPDGPRLERIELRGTLAVWESGRRWRLPAVDGVWAVAGSSDPGVTVRLAGEELRPPPGAPGLSGIAGPAAVWLEVRRLGAAGGFACALQPLRGAWRRLGPCTPGHERRICIGVAAGQALLVESRSRQRHLLAGQGPGSEPWDASPGGPDHAHRLARHGPPGALAAQAIESNGMAVITVASAGETEAEVDLRILAPGGPPAGAPSP